MGKPPEVALGEVGLWIVVGADPLGSPISKAGLEKDVFGAYGALDVVFWVEPCSTSDGLGPDISIIIGSSLGSTFVSSICE